MNFIAIVIVTLIIIVLGAIAVYSFPGGSGSIHLDDVRCTGSESRLIDCSHRGTGVHNCVHSEDAAMELAVALKVCVYNCIHVVPNKEKQVPEEEIKSNCRRSKRMYSTHVQAR